MLRTRQFGAYEVIRKLARGMTDVYLAFDTGANRQAVLKIVEESPDALTQLILEAERRGADLQKQLHDADSRVIEVYDYGHLDGFFFVSMQYIEGRTVAEILKQEGRLEPERAARFTVEILSQLDKLHSFQAVIDGQRRSVVHGDIKPSNVQIGTNDEVRLLDFGIAKALTFTHSRTHLGLGSPSYCSPERLSRGQVDRHADLWAVGVTLYEMIAGVPPYQAQDTRKLEALIQSRRPPRALPEGVPDAMTAILHKALAGDLHQRYVSATAFESDLTLFLQNRPTVAEMERRVSWKSNPTVEKQRPQLPERVASMAETVRRSVMKLKPARAQKLASVMSIFVALSWGLLAGLIVCVPLGYYYRFGRESGALRGKLDFTQASVGEINKDWDLLQRLERRNAFLGRFSPANQLAANSRASLLKAGDGVIERYRNSSDPRVQDFDWSKAALCFTHALEMDRSDRTVQGKLALCHGFENLERSDAGASQAAQQDFEDAAMFAPSLPDPHLGLARVYVYSLRNVGKAVAELHEAQRLGFESGPRELEEEGDGYRFRATVELDAARKAGARDRVLCERNLRLAQRDFDRARQFYEPIEGFSNVSGELRQVDDDDRARQELSQTLTKKPKAARRPRRNVRRFARWQ
ncbi:MAG TPA: serine/threonine-protein kinase [Bryobacteraceae bacterium]|nr:serine/threonine-protein kinase [Bryobacteraceae bacterium]